MSKTIAVDFDGVIAEYDQWCGHGIFGNPIVETIEALEQLEAEGWQIIVCTAREEIDLIREYLIEYAIPFADVTNQKAPAHIYIDDRAIQFNGSWDEILPQLDNFEPWYRRRE